MNRKSSETLGHGESLLATPISEVPPQLLRARSEAAPMKPTKEACAGVAYVKGVLCAGQLLLV